MAITEEKIRKTILTNIWGMFPDVKKLRRNSLTGDKAKWAGHFRHDVEIGGVTKSVIHAWIVRRVGLKKAVKDGFDQYTFELLGFYGYELGTDENNSEDRWQQMIDAVAFRFSDKDIENPVWEFEPDEGESEEEDEVTTESLEFRPIGLILSGETYLHFGGGKLVVNIHPC